MRIRNVALVGRYPALQYYIMQLLMKNVDNVSVSSYIGDQHYLSSANDSQPALLVVIHDRCGDVPVDLLEDAHNFSAGVLVLSEQSRLISRCSHKKIKVIDMSVRSDELCHAVGRLLEKAGASHAKVADEKTDSIILWSLTRKEKEVLGHLCDGISNKAIADRMMLSESTVKFHMRKIFAKTGFQNRVELALMAPQILQFMRRKS